MNKSPDKNYIVILGDLKEKIRQARIRASLSVNLQLLQLYWEIGNTILQQQKKEGWGAKVIKRLSQDLKSEFPDMKGLSERNLVYMRLFAVSYPEFPNVQAPLAQKYNTVKQPKSFTQLSVAKFNTAYENSITQPLVAQIPWAHHITILDKAKTEPERLFYIQKTLENGWSKNILRLQIESNLYGRQGKAITNFKRTLPDIQSDLAQETLKNPYVFDFLSFGERIQERDLEKALTSQLKEFMLELGKGFAYVGNQKNIVVEGDDFFLDLLFYNYRLHCFVIFELKIGGFKPEYAGKMNFYVNTINEQLKTKDDEPTIGVLLCKTPNETVIKYSLQNIKTPIGVADYTLANTLPKQLKAGMPSMKELEAEIEKGYEELKTPAEKKLLHIKELIGDINQSPVKEKRTLAACEKIFSKVVAPLRNTIKRTLAGISSDFKDTEIMTFTDNRGYTNDKELKTYLKEHKGCGEFRIEMKFMGFKPVGTKTFNVWKDIYFDMQDYYYSIGINKHQSHKRLVEKLYHQLPDKQELENIMDTFKEGILDDITQQLERIKREK